MTPQDEEEENTVYCLIYERLPDLTWLQETGVRVQMKGLKITSLNDNVAIRFYTARQQDRRQSHRIQQNYQSKGQKYLPLLKL